MRKVFVIAGLLLVATGLGLWLGRPAYRNWKQERFVSSAKEALRKGDERAAALGARQALAISPTNLEACRIMAAISDKVHSPQAIGWRQRILSIQPESVTNRLELASSAIAHGRVALAAQTLQGIAKTNRNTAAYHQLAAVIAAGLNNIALAEAHFTEALRYDPTNRLLQLNQSVLRLQATDPEVVAGAKQKLEELRQDPVYQRDALRHLAMAAIRSKDYSRAVELTRELQATPKASLEDRLLHLGALRDEGGTEFNMYLAGLETSCVTNEFQASVLISWFLGNDMVPEAERWLDNLPEPMQTNRTVRLARADCLIAQSDWSSLQSLLEDQTWNEADFLRHAMLARASREKKEEFASKAEWMAAVRAASDRPKALTALVKLANKWGWQTEREDLLWTIGEKFPAENWAYKTLGEIYLVQGNTRGLLRLYTAMADFDSDDVVAKNNLAAVSLLLNFQISKAGDLAQEAYSRYPSNEAFASTQAYALFVRGQTNEALSVLEALKPTQLARPSVALYYAAILIANGQQEKAAKYLDIAQTGHLLPEEKEMLKSLKREL